MSTLATLVVKLVGDTTQFHKDMEAAGDKIQDWGAKVTGVGQKLTTGLTLPLMAAAGVAVMAASDMEESQNKVNVVFGESAQVVSNFSNTASTALGMTQQAALEAAGTFGNLFTTMGIGNSEAAKMSTNLLTLAADLASFNNLDPTDVLEKLRAGLVGESEPLRALGINLSAAAIEAKAMEMGLNKTTATAKVSKVAQAVYNKALENYNKIIKDYNQNSNKAKKAAEALSNAKKGLAQGFVNQKVALTDAMKAQAAYALIMEQTSNAQGDFTRTSDGLANQMRIVKAQVVDTAARFGELLLPIVLKAVNYFNDLVNKFMDMDPATKKIIVIIGAIAAALGPVLMVVGSVISAIGTIVGVISAPILLIAGAIALLAIAWNNNWGGMRDTLTAWWTETAQPALQQLWQWLQVNIPLAIQTVSAFWNTTLLPAIKTVFLWVQTNVFPVLSALWSWLATNIPLAIQTLSTFWTTILLPAIQAVWSFLQLYIFPIITLVAQIMSGLLSIAIQALAGLWQNVLLPALTVIWEFIQNYILPILNDLWNFVWNILGPAVGSFKLSIDGLANSFKSGLLLALSWVIEKLQNFRDIISNLKLPKWLQPGSPTPFEIGIRGITDAMKELQSIPMPATLTLGSSIYGRGNTTFNQTIYTNAQTGTLVSDWQRMRAITS